MADQNFPSITPRTLLGVTDIQYTIIDFNDVITDSMTYRAQLKYDDGTYTNISGNAIPHLTAAELAGLQTLISRLRGKAETAWGSA